MAALVMDGLTDWQIVYLRSLVRSDIRRKRAGLDRFAPKPDQDEAEAGSIRAHFEERLARMEDTYRALGGDPDRMNARGGRP